MSINSSFADNGHILVVDDQQDVCDLVHRYLTEEGFRVSIANDGADHPNQVLSRDRLLDLSRHREAGPFDRTVDVQVGRLRRKLEDDPKNPTIIKTVRGAGYIFTPSVDVG